MRRIFVVSIIGLLCVAACGPAKDLNPSEPLSERSGTSVLDAAALQAMLIDVEAGGTVTLPEGTFAMLDGLSLDVPGVTVQGAGQDKTILDFSGQTGAGEGLLVTSDQVTLSGFTIRDTKGDGIKSKGADQIIYRDLTVEWSGAPDESNGAYGVYPVESRDVLVERVTVRGASDAGIYVGQSDNIIVRDSLAEFNVAGIEIENSTRADVYNNTVTHNAGGLLVFDLPDLPKVGGHSTRLFNNRVIENNTRNFAPPGNIVASVPSGTGVIIMANTQVEVFDNTFSDNRTAHVLLVAYAEPFEDARYNPLPRDILVAGNRYDKGGYDPQGDLQPLALMLGGTLPDIVTDGVTRWQGGAAAADLNLNIAEADTVGFINLGLGSYPINPANVAPSTDRPEAASHSRLGAVTLVHSPG